jgi:ADP-ribose pyrophosphatase YjhB (NUDIX family)
MTTFEVRSRPVARVVLIDDEDRVLLFDTLLPYTRVWMTPGGGLKPGERPEDGAKRELWEETGVTDVTLSPCIWRVRFRFEREGLVYDQDEYYFAARAAGRDVDDANREVKERSEILEHRWWRLTEIRSSAASFRPRELAGLLPSILAGDVPEAPLIAGVEGSARVATLPRAAPTL